MQQYGPGAGLTGAGWGKMGQGLVKMGRGQRESQWGEVGSLRVTRILLYSLYYLYVIFDKYRIDSLILLASDFLCMQYSKVFCVCNHRE